MSRAVSWRVLVAAAVVGALLGLWLSPGRGYAEPVPGVSPAAVSPAGIRPCVVEDGSGVRRCVWDGRHMGNGHGRSLVIRRGGTDDASYRYVTHRRAHRLIARWEASH